MVVNSSTADPTPLDLVFPREQYQKGTLDPASLLRRLAARARDSSQQGVWIHVCTDEQIDAQLKRILERRERGTAQPLFGVPFAIKDNIDLAGVPTTAACPAYSYIPRESAAVVQKLCDAGAIAIGKTNLDQFAAGLVGTRSPFGACRNPFNPNYISGGSSSGSAVALATGTVSFALGTDTAGSGRVPAAFNNLVGLKPTRGLLSARGVVPACQSLDCVSLFTLNCGDAQTLLSVAEGFDPGDPYSRLRKDMPPAGTWDFTTARLGIPRKDQLKFFGDAETESLYHQSIQILKKLGATIFEIDYEPFSEAASLLYGGPWVSERYSVVKELFEKDPEAIFPVTRSILSRANGQTAVEAFEAMHRLAALQKRANVEMAKVSALCLPTTGTCYTIEQVNADPVQLNSNLGYYTNFVNLLDLSALAIPTGFHSQSGVPWGITLIAPAGAETSLLAAGDQLHRAANTGAGLARWPVPSSNFTQGLTMKTGSIRVAVLGAHLSGMPLNGQMTERNATLVRKTRTAPLYRFYALPNTTPPKPGLVRVAEGPGASIELEVWEMPIEHYGSFVAGIGSPLGIGTLQLEDGEMVQGFVCEAYAVAGAQDISPFGGWRNYIASLKKS